MIAPRSLITLALGLSLAGCAANALRVEYAGNVSAKGKIAVAASRVYLTKVSASREAFNLDLVGLDANCIPDIAYIRQKPVLKEGLTIAQQDRGWLCDTAASGTNSPYSLAPVAPDIEPTIQLLDSLGLYFSAVDKILTPEGPSPQSDVTAAIGLAGSSDALISAITGGTPVLTDKRRTAIAGFVTFLTDLAAEDDKVTQLRKLAASDAGSEKLVDALLEHLLAWEGSRTANDGARTATAFLIMDRQLRGSKAMTAEERRAAVQLYYTRAGAEVEAGRLYPALSAALTELRDADKAFRRVLPEDGKLTDDERIKLARITRDRVTRAFDTLAALILSFHGS